MLSCCDISECLSVSQSAPFLWEFVKVLLQRLVSLPADVDDDHLAALVDADSDDTAVGVGLKGIAQRDHFSILSLSNIS